MNKTIREKSDILSRLPSSQLSNLREVIPFFIVVTIVVIGLYIAAVSGLGELRTPWRVGALTGLMLIYLVLYWSLLLLPEKILTYAIFLVVQSILAFCITVLSGQVMLSMGLYAPLVGVAVGSLRNIRLTVLAVLGIFSIAALNVFIIPGANMPIGWYWIVIPVTLFVVIYVELYSRQTEAREESQKLLMELAGAHRQLSEYAARVEDLTLANERQRLARELHDTLAQGLVGLILQLEAASSHMQNQNQDRAYEILQQAMSRARGTLADARRAIGNLREVQTIPDDLVESIRTEVKRFSNATGIPCEIHGGVSADVPERIAEHVHRIVSEALTNITRHAQAQRVWLEVSSDSEFLKIIIRDNGVGFDPQALSVSRGHYGLLGMRERARLAGGTVKVESKPGAGTSVQLTLPLKVHSGVV